MHFEVLQFLLAKSSQISSLTLFFLYFLTLLRVDFILHCLHDLRLSLPSPALGGFGAAPVATPSSSGRCSPARAPALPEPVAGEVLLELEGGGEAAKNPA